MNGRQAKHQRREARALARERLRMAAMEQVVVKRRWWLRPAMALTKALDLVGIRLSQDRLLGIARAGLYIGRKESTA